MYSIIIIALLFAIEIYYHYFKYPERANVYCKRNGKAFKIVSHIKRLNEWYYPPFFFSNGHLHVLLLYILYYVDFYTSKEIPYIQKEIILEDGEILYVDYMQTVKNVNTETIIVMIYGVTGNRTDFNSLLKLLRHYQCIVVHRRGHSGLLKSPHFNMFGEIDDLHNQLEVIKKDFPHSKIVLIGSSAGSSLVCRYISHYRNKHHISNAVLLSTAFHLEKTLKSIHPLWDYLLKNRLVNFFVKPNEKILSRSNSFMQRIYNAKSSFDFVFHASSFSKTSSSYDEYQKEYDTETILKRINIPTLIINALDDPLCHYQSVLDYGINAVSNDNICLLTTKKGSHLCHIHQKHFHYSMWGELIVRDWIHYSSFY
jgi:predicted alpha/beta-fold hydrolase